MKTLVSSQHVLSTRACLKTQCLQTSTSGSSCFKYFVIHFHWQPALCVDINVKLLIKELQAGMDRTIIITYQLLMACLRHLGTPMSTAGTQHWNKHVPAQTHSCRRHKHIKQAPDTELHQYRCPQFRDLGFTSLLLLTDQPRKQLKQVSPVKQ